MRAIAPMLGYLDSISENSFHSKYSLLGVTNGYNEFEEISSTMTTNTINAEYNIQNKIIPKEDIKNHNINSNERIRRGEHSRKFQSLLKQAMSVLSTEKPSIVEALSLLHELYESCTHASYSMTVSEELHSSVADLLQVSDGDGRQKFRLIHFIYYIY